MKTHARWLAAVWSTALGAVLMLWPMAPRAETPRLSISLKHDNPLEQRKREQLERLAAQYDLKKFTITREILIEQGAVAHSKPVLTMNGRFMDSDDLTLSQFVHEQGHWVLGQHRADLRDLLRDLIAAFPGIPTAPPQGSAGTADSYYHLAVIQLEWQALDELLGPDRARAAEEFKQTDHYTGLYATVLANRPRVASVLNHHHIRW